MTRQEAKDLLIKMGIAEPTEENINDMLNSIGKNSKAKDDLVERQKSRIAEIEAELEAKKKALEDIDNEKLSDIDKLQKQIEQLTKKSEADQLTIKNMNLKNGLAEQGIIGEDADKLIASLNNGEFDFVTLGKIITERESKAVSAKEKELLDGTPNPNGANNNNGDNNAETDFFKSIGKSLVGENTSDIISNYT